MANLYDLATSSTSWYIHRVTPLADFEQQSCGAYSSSLRGDLLRRFGVVDSGDTTVARVRMLESTNPELFVEITCSVSAGSNVRERRCTMVLCFGVGRGGKQSDVNGSEQASRRRKHVRQGTAATTTTSKPKIAKRRRLAAFASFKFLMIKGDDTASVFVVEWLERKFDCAVARSSLRISAERLRTAVDEWEKFGLQFARPHPRPLKLKFALSNHLSKAGISSITVAVERDEIDEVSKVEHSLPAHEILNEHVLGTLKLRLEKATLVAIRTSIADLNSVGRLELRRTSDRPKTVNRVLRDVSKWTAR